MKLKVAVLISLITFCLFVENVKAATEPPLFPYNLTWNIERVYYYLNSSSLYYSYPISKAANNWVYTGYGYNRLYPNKRAYNISNSAIAYNYPDGNNAGTLFVARVGGTGSTYYVEPFDENWLFGEVYLNDYYLMSQTNNYVQGVVAHEMGHVFGLNENNTNPVSIMCQSAFGRSVYTVQQVDNNSFNRKHP